MQDQPRLPGGRLSLDWCSWSIPRIRSWTTTCRVYVPGRMSRWLLMTYGPIFQGRRVLPCVHDRLHTRLVGVSAREAPEDTLDVLAKAGLCGMGTGRDTNEAECPAVVTREGGRRCVFLPGGMDSVAFLGTGPRLRTPGIARTTRALHPDDLARRASGRPGHHPVIDHQCGPASQRNSRSITAERSTRRPSSPMALSASSGSAGGCQPVYRTLGPPAPRTRHEHHPTVELNGRAWPAPGPPTPSRQDERPCPDECQRSIVKGVPRTTEERNS